MITTAGPDRRALFSRAAWLPALCVLALLCACSAESESQPDEDEGLAAVTRGLQHYQTYQCGSCHSTDWGEPPEQSCSACHDRIEDVALGLRQLSHQPTLQRYTAKQIDMAHEHIRHFKAVPRLGGVGQLYRADWLEQYLQTPHDVRPRLEETMPRLRVNAEQARDIVAYLQVAADNPLPNPLWDEPSHKAFDEPVGELVAGDIERGRTHYQALECGKCHAFSGVLGEPPPRGNEGFRRGVLLAPDLAATRQRFRPDRLVAYLLDPQRNRPTAAMPQYDLSLPQARDLAAFIMHAQARPLPDPEPAVFLPLLDRGVGYVEVAERVFNRICVHCHGPTTPKRVADGPGNSGGFGFVPRKLDLSSYEAVRSGVLFEGERTGILQAGENGEPALLVKVLKARHHEERAAVGAALPELRGMPLGLPALSLEEVQLIESWVAQGAPYRALPQ